MKNTLRTKDALADYVLFVPMDQLENQRIFVIRIASVLNVSMESLITPAVQRAEEDRRRPSFELFKSNTCHKVKDMGDNRYPN